MVVVYLSVGGILLFTDTFGSISGAARTILGIALMGYAAFRAYGIYTRHKRNLW
jgi:hypothetical protein